MAMGARISAERPIRSATGSIPRTVARVVMAIGRNFLSFIAVDTADDAAKAVKALRKL